MTASSGVERRTDSRVRLAVDVTLSRGRGGPIVGRTLDVGAGGMRVATNRPLAIDELLSFHVPSESDLIQGRVRVLREHAHSVYALRFERGPDDAVGRLSRLAEMQA